MHVIFVEPAFPRNQREFVRGLRQAGATVTGVGERPWDALDGELKGWLHAYERVGSVCHEGQMTDAVRRIQARGWVDRLEATVEAHILPVARVRAACTIPGTSIETAFLCRDKPAMKERLRGAGVPCARSIGTASADDVRAFAAEVGYPLILKPRDAAGAAGTVRVDREQELGPALAACGVEQGHPVAVEEFVEGHEGFYDTLAIGGRVVHEFVTHYFPNVLEAMRTRWISPQFVTTNRLDDPSYAEARELGRKVIAALGIETSATHMEWFFGPKGLKFSEIGCRPAGVGAWDLYCAANDFDLYHDWGNAIVHGRAFLEPSRRFSAGIINLRPTQDGTIRRYEGLEAIREQFGAFLIDWHLPEPGTATQPVSAGYMANAWVRARHPDFDELRRILDTIGRTLRVVAE